MALRFGLFELAGEAVAVEDDVGGDARHEAVAGAEDIENAFAGTFFFAVLELKEERVVGGERGLSRQRGREEAERGRQQEPATSS